MPPPQEIRPFFRDFEAPLSHEGLLGARVLTSFHLSLDSKPLENHMQKPRNWNFLEDFPNDVPCEVLKKVPIFFFSGWNPSHLCGNSHKPWNKDPFEATRIQWKVISFFLICRGSCICVGRIEFLFDLGTSPSWESSGNGYLDVPWI